MGVKFDVELTEELSPRVLPPGWAKIRGEANMWHTNDGVSIIASAEIVDGERWWHVSCARPNRLPSWDDVRKVKDIFVGRDKTAVQVLPSQDRYVNDNPHVLHLWRCLDREIVPDFRRLGGTL